VGILLLIICFLTDTRKEITIMHRHQIPQKQTHQPSSEDEIYLKAVAEGKMDTVKRLVDEAALSNPFYIGQPAYHFTRSDFKTFDNKRAKEMSNRRMIEYLDQLEIAEKSATSIPQYPKRTPGWATEYGQDYVFPADAHFFFIGQHPPEDMGHLKGSRKIQAYLINTKMLDLTKNMSGEEFRPISEYIQKKHTTPPMPGQAGHRVSGIDIGGFRRAKKEGVTPQQLFNFMSNQTFYTKGVEWREMMSELGYDSVKFESNSSGTSILEPRRGIGDGKTYTVVAVLNSSQIMSADPATYDDEGNIIPLSKRFNNK